MKENLKMAAVGPFLVIFLLTEIQTVILMCLMGQNLNWFKSYETKCTLSLCKILARSEIYHQNLQLVCGIGDLGRF